jgi:hypothetical protein
MLLDAQDFSDEQSHHRQRLSAVLARLHGAGTVAGLRAVAVRSGEALPDGTVASEDRVLVEPGLAVDREGRLIEVPTARTLRVGPWFEGIRVTPASVLKPLVVGAAQRWFVADVFLRYTEFRQGLRPTFPERGVDATDAVSPARLKDGFELLLVPRSAETPGVPPPLPRPAFRPAPTTRDELLKAVYDAYRLPAPVEYPVEPTDGSLAGVTVRKLADQTAVFLARLLIRLTDAPAAGLERHANLELKLDDRDRLVLPAVGLLLGLTSLG